MALGGWGMGRRGSWLLRTVTPTFIGGSLGCDDIRGRSLWEVLRPGGRSPAGVGVGIGALRSRPETAWVLSPSPRRCVRSQRGGTSSAHQDGALTEVSDTLSSTLHASPPWARGSICRTSEKRTDHLHLSSFFKIHFWMRHRIIYLFICYLFIFRERGSRGERNVRVWLPLLRPLLSG